MLSSFDYSGISLYSVDEIQYAWNFENLHQVTFIGTRFTAQEWSKDARIPIWDISILGSLVNGTDLNFFKDLHWMLATPERCYNFVNDFKVIILSMILGLKFCQWKMKQNLSSDIGSLIKSPRKKKI